MFLIAFGIIRDTFTQGKLSVAQGIFSSMFSAGAVIGILFSDKNTKFYCRFIHVRKNILLSESISSSSNISKNNKSTIDIMGAITLSITTISFLIALQLTQTVNTAAANYLPTVIVFGVAAIIAPLTFFCRSSYLLILQLINSICY
jgi:hypothetical protein